MFDLRKEACYKLLMRVFFLILLFLPQICAAEPSLCFGTTSNGSLRYGVQLPSSGKNYESYSRAARLAGRTYVHSEVKAIIVEAYKSLEESEPNKKYKYVETGKKNGGQFKPHKTHQNGLSVDFMTPVMNSKGESVHLPTNLLNRLGYDIEFNSNNTYDGLEIDYVALAAHIVELHKQAKKSGHDLWRVIFAPELQPPLFETKYGDYLKTHIQFSTKRSWVRHDEHYHVDFQVPCEGA